MLSCSKNKKTINIPEQLEVYPPIGTQKRNNPLIADNLKIYTLINVSCSTCLLQIQKWDNFQKVLNETGVSVIPICYSKDNFELLKYLYESRKLGDLQLSLYLDTNNQLIKQNKSLVSAAGKLTVLVNAKDEILLRGSPVENSTMKKKYITTIKKHSLD